MLAYETGGDPVEIEKIMKLPDISMRIIMNRKYDLDKNGGIDK